MFEAHYDRRLTIEIEYESKRERVRFEIEGGDADQAAATIRENMAQITSLDAIPTEMDMWGLTVSRIDRSIDVFGRKGLIFEIDASTRESRLRDMARWAGTN